MIFEWSLILISHDRASYILWLLSLFFRIVATKAVRKNAATAKATDTKVESHVKDWLKFAAERDGGRKQRDINKRCERRQQSPSESLYQGMESPTLSASTDHDSS